MAISVQVGEVPVGVVRIAFGERAASRAVRIQARVPRLTPTEVPAGSVVVSEREAGELFYVITSGRVRVSHGDRVSRAKGPGDYFGEIALLRDVPRTATVTASEDSVLLSLARSPFLKAVTGSASSRPPSRTC